MIPAAMAVTAAGTITSERSAYAREARVGRSAALVLDAIVFGFITFVVNSVYGVTEVTSAAVSSSGSVMSTTTAVGWPWLTLLGVLYFAIPEAMFGASIGKRLVGLSVVRLGGGPLAVRDVTVRNLLKPIDFLPILYLLGGVFVLATPGSQRIGDLVAGTTVVYQRRVPEIGATLTSTARARRILVGVLLAALLFTAGFDYFGRPPLVIQGLFKTGQLPPSDATSYALGQPSWSVGKVTYPVTTGRISGTDGCSGTVELRWELSGWQESGASFECLPGLKTPQ